MVAASILPITIHKNNIYFLFGKENELEDSAKGFSDFGGKVDANESIMETALREGSEELCGFLGNPQQLKNLIKKNGGVYRIKHNDYHVHLFYIEYDENLPEHFTNNHRFLWERMDKHMLNDTKLFEKQEIKWFSLKEMKSKRNEFRSFYKEIVDLFFENMSNIRNFVKKMEKNKKMKRRSRKNHFTKKYFSEKKRFSGKKSKTMKNGG